MKASVVCGILAAGIFMLLAVPAMAASGCITGQLRFIQANQGYCPTTRTCTSDYQQAQYKNASGSPLRRVRVELKTGSSLMGQGVTDLNGNFTVSWSKSGSVSSGHVRILGKMIDNGTEVFNIGQWNQSNTYVINDTSISYTNGTNCSAPQNVGTIIVGTTTTPNDLANIYDAAERTWRRSVVYSHIASEVPVIDIEFPADSGSCGTGCWSAGTKRVGIPDVNSDALLGGARTAHEIGHLAVARTYPSNTPNYCNRYNYDSDGGWDLYEEEWGCAAFHEANATFVGDVSRYWWGEGTIADTCRWNQLTVCTAMLDDSAYCQSGEDRWPLSGMRFLWDAYDSNVDGPNSESNNESYYSLVKGMSYFAAGTGERQRDEWQGTGGGSGSSNDPDDQAGAYDYWWNYWDQNPDGGVALYPSYYNACSPPGDR